MNVEDIELRDLRYYLACLDHASLTEAAAALHVAQPTISHAIRRLEAAVGEAILYRNRSKDKTIQATPLGRRLAEHGQRMLGELHDLERSDSSGELRGRLRLGSIQSLNLSLLPPVLAQLIADHPQLDLEMHTFEATDMATAVRAHQVDLGLVAGAPERSLHGLQVADLYAEAFVAVLHRDDPLAQKDQVSLKSLGKRNLVLPPADSYTGQSIYQAFRSAAIQARVRLSLSSGESLRALVRAGLGPTILPAGYVPVDDPCLCAKTISPAIPARQVVALYPGGDHPSRAVSALLALLHQHIP